MGCTKNVEIPCSNGLQQIYIYIWEPSISPKGIVQIVHGMQEHMGRYHDFAQYMVSQGFIVAGHDKIGHGLTALNWGSFGYFGERDGAKYLVSDCNHLSCYLKKTYPSLPLFLLGHSMGSLEARMACLWNSKEIQGFICMGTLGQSSIVPVLRAFDSLIIKIHGPKGYSPLINKILSITKNRELSNKEPPNTWLTHDTKIVEEFTKDPFTQFEFTLQGYADLLDLVIACNRTKWYELFDKKLPILLVSGSEDPLSNMGEEVLEICEKLDQYHCEDVSCKIYPNMRHEILNEVDRFQVYQDIIEWVWKRL